ncbi:hypothetical protein GCM10020219_041850 [Nonomuraea dietziae]
MVVQAAASSSKAPSNADKTKWVSKEPLRADQTATASRPSRDDDGGGQLQDPQAQVELEVADVTPNQKGEKVGVGAPIILTFNNPVSDKAAWGGVGGRAEKPVEGAWRWINDKTVIYRTAKYWPPTRTSS